MTCTTGDAMTTNVGDLDRGVRMAAGIMAMALGFSGVVAGTTGVALIVTGAVALATGLSGRCLLYRVLGWNRAHRRA
jgi:hypothetical protein